METSPLSNGKALTEKLNSDGRIRKSKIHKDNSNKYYNKNTLLFFRHFSWISQFILYSYDVSLNNQHQLCNKHAFIAIICQRVSEQAQHQMIQ